MGSPGAPAPFSGPRAEASWARGAELLLTVRFIYREGPVAAVQGAAFPKTSLRHMLQRVCEGVRALQEDVEKQKAQEWMASKGG